MARRTKNRYQSLVERIFFDRFRKGASEVSFVREDLREAADQLGITLPANLGDVLYSVRYRTPLPERIRATQPDDREWIIEGRGRAQYAFRLVPINRIVPNPKLRAIKIPDSTPEVISAYALDDEQALLAKVRYNRLLDIFLGIATYSMQNHLRTSVSGIGQIEIDELYVGIDRRGVQFVFPVQAKGGGDQLSVVQTRQDVECCAQKFPQLTCRPISAQFMGDDQIAIFELVLEEDQILVADERHYRLVPSSEITARDLARYGRT